jgi:hypothetical protein
VVVNHQVLVSEPKTAKGRRSIALDPATVAALRDHRRWQLEERLAVGPRWEDSAWIHRNVLAPCHVFTGQRPFADRRRRTKKMHGSSGVNTP